MEKTLFEECIEALDNNIQILSHEQTNTIFSGFEETFPITGWGLVDWDKVNIKAPFDRDEPESIIPILEGLIKDKNNKISQKWDSSCYILWDDASLPIIKSDLYSVIKNIDDVTCMCIKTWLFNLNAKYIVEWHVCGNKTVGVLI